MVDAISTPQTLLRFCMCLTMRKQIWSLKIGRYSRYLHQLSLVTIPERFMGTDRDRVGGVLQLMNDIHWPLLAAATQSG